MTEKFWLEISSFIMGTVVAIYVMKTKTAGWGARSIQAIIIAVGIPAIIVLSLEQLLNSQAVAALLGAMVGFGVGQTVKD